METLQTPYGRFTTYINQLNSFSQVQFHISFVDKKNKLHVIQMYEKGNAWNIATPEKHPDWIIALNAEFERLIKRELLKGRLCIALAS